MTSETEGRGAERLAEKRDHLREKASERADEGKSFASEQVDKTRRDAEAKLDEGRARTSGAARRVADALDDAAGDMDERGPARPALGSAADGARRVADMIDDNTLGDAANAVAGFARRNPVAFLGAAALTGFAISRFATAEPDDGYDDDPYDDDYDLDDDYVPGGSVFDDRAAYGDPLSEGSASPRPVASPTEAIPPRAPTPAPVAATPLPSASQTGGKA